MKSAKKILILEDDKNFAESIKVHFENKNWNVKIAHSAKQAEQFITFERYDVLIVDVVLRTKINGIGFLKEIITKGLLPAHCTVLVISGVLSKNILSRDLQDHVDSFIKKPFNIKIIEDKIESFTTTSQDVSHNVNFFYLEISDKENLLKNKEYIIKGHELMFIAFYLNHIGFDGELKISTSVTDRKSAILFKKGNMISFQDMDTHYKLGDLLVKNGLVSKSIIEELVSKKGDSPLGQRLIEGFYISPHQLNHALKQQQAIGLFKYMDFPTIKVKCNDFIFSDKFDQFVGLETRDLYALVHNWIYSKVNTDWIKEFFNIHKQVEFKSLRGFSDTCVLESYPRLESLFSTKIEEDQKVQDILNTSKKGEDILRELYSRILVRENCLSYVEETSTFNRGNYQFLKDKYLDFLNNSKTKNYFELLNLSLNTKPNELEEVYRNMLRIFHPDRRDHSIPPDLVKIYDQCFLLVKKIYQTLNDPAKRARYLKNLEAEEREKEFKVTDIYIKGKAELAEGNYQKSLKTLGSILDHMAAPNNIVLYYIYALIKSKDFKINSEEKNQIEDLFKRVGMDSKQEAMYPFSRGLFLKATGRNKEAFNLFTKALMLDPKLKEARIERYSLRKVSSTGKENFFKNLFNKKSA